MVEVLTLAADGVGAGVARADEDLRFHIGLDDVWPPDEVVVCDEVLVVRREVVCIVIGIHGVAEANLLEVAGAGDGARLLACLRERWQKHGGQDGDDGDDDQQFNQGEAEEFFHEEWIPFQY